MLFINNRYNKDGTIIEDIKNYKSAYSKELEDFLSEQYSKDKKNHTANNTDFAVAS